ncbi:MAG: amino acid ABC transporter permease, partial [Proteobacteria bacterium]|nr:amino acid ABC transporter permease [Pseudomonadota bacterium]
ATWQDSVLTVVGLAIMLYLGWHILDWAVFTAAWSGEDGSVCRNANVGACWPFVRAKFGTFMFGRYPDAERWRVLLTYALAAFTIVWLAVPATPGKRWFALFGLFILPIIGWALLCGGVFGLKPVPTELWGGLLVTLVVATVGIVGSFPIGIVLALGRRSQMPIARWVSIFFIEVVRAVPLITVLFMASVMLPLFLPDGVSFDKLLRALIGVMFFAGAYMAETIRGGLQAIPKGQAEAADALGLSFPQKMGLIILPQALKLVIPGIVNSFVGLAKDTSLVLIIGIFDLLGIVQTGLTDPKWFAPNTAMTGYVFTAFIFWVICFSISRYSAWLEARLSRGDRR